MGATAAIWRPPHRRRMAEHQTESFRRMAGGHQRADAAEALPGQTVRERSAHFVAAVRGEWSAGDVPRRPVSVRCARRVSWCARAHRYCRCPAAPREQCGGYRSRRRWLRTPQDDRTRFRHRVAPPAPTAATYQPRAGTDAPAVIARQRSVLRSARCRRGGLRAIRIERGVIKRQHRLPHAVANSDPRRLIERIGLSGESGKAAPKLINNLFRRAAGSPPVNKSRNSWPAGAASGSRYPLRESGSSALCHLFFVGYPV